jgi:hypothetical protein
MISLEMNPAMDFRMGSIAVCAGSEGVQGVMISSSDTPLAMAESIQNPLSLT